MARAVTISTPSSKTTASTPNVTLHAPLSCIEIDRDKTTGKNETTLEGRVACGSHSHPNGSVFDFCYLQLDEPRCVMTSGDVVDDDSVDQIQLVGGQDFKKMEGSRLRVTGEPFPRETAWHVRPVLILTKTIAPAR